MNAWISVLAGFRQLVQPAHHASSRTFVNSSYVKRTTGDSHVGEFTQACRSVVSQYSRWLYGSLIGVTLRYRGTRAGRCVQGARVNPTSQGALGHSVR